MNSFYNQEKNTQILIALLKKHNIKHIIVSPGMTNISFVASVQNDPFFKLYSAVDERSAAYMACGLAYELNTPVALSCTGATASRNYVPALTEAYYRNLPVLAITSSQPSTRIGHNIPQVTDRAHPMKDIVKFSTELSPIHTEEEEWACSVNANKALIELKKDGGGPVHINLITVYNTNFTAKKLPAVKAVRRISYESKMPEIPDGKVAVFIGSHGKMSAELEKSIDDFCEVHNAVVLVDSTSNYNGKYRIFGNLVANQSGSKCTLNNIDLLIHIGMVSGSYMRLNPKRVWRVSPDGKYCDTFKKLQFIFDMSERYFFKRYSRGEKKPTSYYEAWKDEYTKMYNKIPELPFSNLWAAYTTKKQLPANSSLHLGILNSLRCWNYFESDRSIDGYSNVGGFGIDGSISSLLGASLVNPDKLYYCVLGDLAFFYDLNAVGNRHIGKNLRIMVVNNGVGFEFKHRSAIPTQAGIEDQVDNYIAAAGHFGKKSKKLLKNYVEELGFTYISASTKKEFTDALPVFLNSKTDDKPVFFEVFTNADSENEAQYLLTHMAEPPGQSVKNQAKKLIGENNVKALKTFLHKK